MSPGHEPGRSPGEVDRHSRSDWIWVLVGLVVAAGLVVFEHKDKLAAYVQGPPARTAAVPASAPKAAPGRVTSAQVKPSFLLDLETGNTDLTPGADLWWHFATRQERALETRNGALMARVDGHEFEAIDATFLARLRYALVRLPASGDASQVKAGSIIAVRTAEGNLAKVRIRRAEPGLAALELEWVLYRGVPAPASAASPSPPAVATAPVPPDQWSMKLQQGLDAYRDKRPGDALALYAEALEAARTFGASGPRAAFVLYRTGSLYWSMQRLNDAELTWTEALRLALKLREADIQAELGADRTYLVADIYRGLGLIYRQQVRRDDALRAFGKSVAALESSTAAVRPELRSFMLLGGYVELGGAQCAMQQWDLAKSTLAKAQAIAAKTAGSAGQLKIIETQMKSVERQAPC